jgi:hypothetical protein
VIDVYLSIGTYRVCVFCCFIRGRKLSHLTVARCQFENKGKGTSAVGSRYKRTDEVTADSIRAEVNCRL